MVLLVAVTASTLALAQSTPARSYWVHCGTRQPSIFITTKAHGVGCTTARRVGRKYALDDDRNPLGFRCSAPRTLSSGEAFKGQCRRRGARIKVDFGV